MGKRGLVLPDTNWLLKAPWVPGEDVPYVGLTSQPQPAVDVATWVRRVSTWMSESHVCHNYLPQMLERDRQAEEERRRGAGAAGSHVGMAEMVAHAPQ